MKIMNKITTLVFSLTMMLGAYSAHAIETKITYYVPDALGSPIAAMDEQGNVKWRKHYRPYGEEIEQDAASKDNRIGYTGHAHDRDTGLTYMGARHYDPLIGRFMGMDPAGVNANDPRTFNRYAYANNNPYKYTDPDGGNAVWALERAWWVGSKIGSGINFGIRTLAGGSSLGFLIYDVVHNENSNDVRGENVRSTDEPVDLEEDLAGQEILGGFSKGEGDNISDKMGDPRYDPETGTQDKLRGSHTHSDGTVTEVHADRNRKTGELSDTKYKDSPDNSKSRAGLY